MGKNDLMRGWGYPVCDECATVEPVCNTCNTANTINTANTCHACDMGYASTASNTCGTASTANTCTACNTCNAASTINTCNTCNAANTCSTCGTYAETACSACQTAAANGEMHVYFDGCEGIKEVALNCDCDNAQSMGRVLDVNVKLCNMCPGRCSAVGVNLVEIDQHGGEFSRGFRAISVPAHGGSTNRDVALPTQRFILPEDMSACGNRRHFVVRTTNHYLEQPQW